MRNNLNNQRYITFIKENEVKKGEYIKIKGKKETIIKKVSENSKTKQKSISLPKDSKINCGEIVEARIVKL